MILEIILCSEVLCHDESFALSFMIIICWWTSWMCAWCQLACSMNNLLFLCLSSRPPYLFIAIAGLHVPGLKLVKDMEFDGSKICIFIEEPLLHQQGIRKFVCKCNRNFTINRVCLDLQYYQSINLFFKNEELILTPELLLDYGLVHQLVCSDPSQTNNFGRKVALGLIQGFKMNKKFVDAIIISKTPKWISDDSLLPAQHYISFYYHNRRPTLLSCPLEQPDICAESLINQIKHWKASHQQGLRSLFKEHGLSYYCRSLS